MPPVPGVRLAACEAGIRYAGRTDLMVAVLDPGTTAAGVLTLTFNREEDSIGQATLVVQIDTDLAGPWTDFAPIGATGSGPVSINTTPDPDAVTVTIPSVNAAGGKLFARLKATQP